MKHFGILSLFFAAVAAVLAVRAEDNPDQETTRTALLQKMSEQNAQMPPATNPAVAPSVTNAVLAPTYTNANTRAMSLQDCIQEALQHNLDVQIQRYNPQISLYNLRAAYGGYDPTFNASGQHNYDVSGSILENGFEVPGSVSDQNSFNSSIRRHIANGVAI